MQKLSPGSHLAGKYNVLSLVDTRSYCVKYMVRDSVLLKQWILKQFEIPKDDDQKKEFLDHFYAEGEREGAITIEQLPRSEEFFAEKGCAWTVTEFIPGKSIAEHLEENGGRLDEEAARAWTMKVADAIQFLHGQEPRMVLGGFDREEFTVTESGAIRLREYGMPRIYPPSRRGEIPAEGLPRWYDSDMLRNAKATRQADIWSLGALAYYLLTGVDATHEGRKGLKSLRPEVSDEFAQVIEKCLEPFGDNVYHAIEEVIDDLSGRHTIEKTIPPRLAVLPPRLEFRNVPPGEVVIERFRIINEGGGTLAGHVHSSSPWLQVSPQHFEGNDQEMQVWIDTGILDEDTRAKGHVLVTSANEELKLPVTLELAVSRVGGLSPKVGSTLMFLLAIVPLAVIAFFNITLLQDASAFLNEHMALSADPGSSRQLVDMRFDGTMLLVARFAAATLVPILVYGVWRLLSISARRRTALMTAVTMLLPALAVLIAMRASESTFAALPIATWMRATPTLGGWWCIFGNIVATMMLLTPGNRYPGFFAYSTGLRVLLAALLLGGYGWLAWSFAVG